ncbi:MAG: ion channel protein [Gordonia sp. (in: high G+C Gram-positive bacteria)]|uniref:ion channel protein n=1 Tax=Gordonia sp. (in: high G+C Gram-positive bacteria) TaxID=84139 RepID=UPI003C75B535
MAEGNPASPGAEEFRSPVGRMIALTPVAIAAGVLCALGLAGLSAVADFVQKLVWHDLSSAVGASTDDWWWIMVVLTMAGLITGLVIRWMPGHAGDDPATIELLSEPLPLKVLPGLIIATIVTLAGGVSLGPENPIMAINAAVIVVLGARLIPKVPHKDWAGLASAATIGALFGTPVAAALMLSELNSGDTRIPLWNRLYLPLVAAATGSFVILHFTDLTMSMGLPEETVGGLGDLLRAVGVGVAAAAVGIVGAMVFDPLHRLLHRSMRNPVLLLTAAGAALGALGVLGGSITLFKGLEQMKELPAQLSTTTAVGFFVFAGVKLCAMLLASAAGFRGGRIFPAVFIGAALGFGTHVLIPSIPLVIAVTAAVVGISVAATRNGWISLFLALAMVPQFDLMIPLLFATLAAWLLVANAPELKAAPLETIESAGSSERT